MGSMSASDAAPLPRLGEVFFDVRGNSRSMRLSWYADTGVAVLSIWQGGMCTGTFRLAIDDLPRMVETLRRGPGGQSPDPEPEAPDRAFGDVPGDANQAEPADYGTAAMPYLTGLPDPLTAPAEYLTGAADPLAGSPGYGDALYPGHRSDSSYSGGHPGASLPGHPAGPSYPGHRGEASYPGGRPDRSYPDVGPGGSDPLGTTGPGGYPERRGDDRYLGSTGPMDFPAEPPPAHYPPGTSAAGHGSAPGRGVADYPAHYGGAATDDMAQSPPPESFPYGRPPGNRGPAGRHADPGADRDAPFD